MILNEVEKYVEDREREGLTKIEIVLEHAETIAGFDVRKTKETYVFTVEEEADRKVNEVRQYPNFAGVEKKFKQGKMNKAGEVTKEDSWVVVVKLSF